MADKPEFVDMIREATRQTRRRIIRRTADPEVVKPRSRLSHWPPERWVQWRVEKFMPWKLKPWE